jgi:hypothetical protein
VAVPQGLAVPIEAGCSDGSGEGPVAVGLMRCGAELELLSPGEGGDAEGGNGGIGEPHVAQVPSQEAI